MRATGLAVLLALIAGACVRASWPAVGPGNLPPDRVALAGIVRFVPPLSTGPFAGRKRMLALFTADAREAWRDDRTLPLERYDGAWVTDDEPFFIEAPRSPPFLLRGFLVEGAGGYDAVETSVAIDFASDDEVVCVGVIQLVRVPEQRVVVRAATDELRKHAQARGLRAILARRWAERPPVPL